jgi:hypothetical protein
MFDASPKHVPYRRETPSRTINGSGTKITCYVVSTDHDRRAVDEAGRTGALQGFAASARSCRDTALQTVGRFTDASFPKIFSDRQFWVAYDMLDRW